MAALSLSDRELVRDYIKASYVDVLTLVERLHHRMLDATKDELDRKCRADINPVQALLLYNIGDEELSARHSYYLGSNVSHNLKKLVKMGFLDQKRSCTDRKTVRMRLTDKGRKVRDLITAVYTVKHVGGITSSEFFSLNKSLHRLERFWLINASIDPETAKLASRATAQFVIR